MTLKISAKSDRLLGHSTGTDGNFLSNEAALLNGSYSAAEITVDLFDYTDWAEKAGLLGDAAALTADADDDGMDNLLEFALGGDPLFDDAASVLPVFQTLENHVTYVHRERIDDSTLNYTVLACTNLVSNLWKTNGVEWVGEAAFSNGWKTVTNEVPILGKPQQFIRLKIEQ